MSLDRRSFLQGIAAVLSASAVPTAVAAETSMAQTVGRAEGSFLPIGSVVMVHGFKRPPVGFVFLEGQTLKATDFPEIAAYAGCTTDGAVQLQDMQDATVGTLRWVMRVA